MAESNDLHIKNFDRELKNQAKTKALALDQTLREFVIEAIRKAVGSATVVTRGGKG